MRDLRVNVFRIIAAVELLWSLGCMDSKVNIAPTDKTQLYKERLEARQLGGGWEDFDTRAKFDAWLSDVRRQETVVSTSYLALAPQMTPSDIVELCSLGVPINALVFRNAKLDESTDWRQLPCRDMERITFTNCDLSVAAVDFRDDFPQLRTVSFVNSSVSNEVLDQLAESMGETIEVLAIFGSTIDDTAIPSWKKFRKLEELHLTGSHRTDRTLIAIAEIPTLKMLDIGMCDPYPKTARLAFVKRRPDVVWRERSCDEGSPESIGQIPPIDIMPHE